YQPGQQPIDDTQKARRVRKINHQHARSLINVATVRMYVIPVRLRKSATDQRDSVTGRHNLLGALQRRRIPSSTNVQNGPRGRLRYAPSHQTDLLVTFV